MPDHYIVISPLYYDSKTTSTQLTKSLEAGKKTIFVSMGSTGEWERMMFLNHPHFRQYNIIAAGDDQNLLSAAHIIKAAFVNIHELFPITDLVICHGGNGTVYQSLLYGIPLLCITNNFEQEWNVEALEKQNAGMSIGGITGTDELIAIVTEWVTKKEMGLNRRYPLKIRAEAEKLGAAIRKIAWGITRLGVKVS